MKKEQIIQILQFIAAWALIVCFVIFVMKETFIDFFMKYRFLAILASISYFYYYSIQYETDKKYNLIRNVLIYGNLYLLAHIFFRPLLNISHQLFILLGLIILGIWWTTKLKTRWKVVLQVLGGIFSFFILISGLFYLYPDAPDIEGFLQTRAYKLSVFSLSDIVKKKDAYLKLVYTQKSEDVEITSSFNRIISENCQISYPSLKKNRHERIVFMTVGGDIIMLNPQSEMRVSFSGNKLSEIRSIAGNIGFSSGMLSSYENYNLVGDFIANYDSGDIQMAQSIYQRDLVKYLKNQISDSNMGLADTTIMYNIDGIVLKFLSKLFPASFGVNMRNYNSFQYYFSLVDANDIDLGRYTQKTNNTVPAKKVWKTILENAMDGKESMRFL